MRIKMLVQVSGTRNGAGEWPRIGEELNVSDVEGIELCASGMAEPVAVIEKSERAVTPAPERRVGK